MTTPEAFHPVRWTDEEIAALWDFYAAHRAGTMQYFSKSAGHWVLEQANAVHRLGGVRRVLDFGCGPGFFLEHLSRHSATRKAELYGVDFSLRSVEEARQRLAGCAQVRDIGYVSTLPTDWPDGFFDLVTSLEVVEHLDDAKLNGALGEAARLLRPGGLLVVTTPNAEDLDLNTTACPCCKAVFHRWQHLRTWTADSLGRAVTGHGFDIVKVIGTRFEPRLHRLGRRLLGVSPDANLLGVFRKR